MKRIILNIPKGYDDVLSITCIGGVGTMYTNVKTEAYDLTKVNDEKEIFVCVEKKCGRYQNEQSV